MGAWLLLRSSTGRTRVMLSRPALLGFFLDTRQS